MQGNTSVASKKKDLALKEFARSLNEEDLRFVGARLYQRYGGDMGEALEFLQNYGDLDRYLGLAKDAYGVYDVIDEIAQHVEAEVAERDEERRRQFDRRESR